MMFIIGTGIRSDSAVAICRYSGMRRDCAAAFAAANDAARIALAPSRDLAGVRDRRCRDSAHAAEFAYKKRRLKSYLT